MGRIFLSARVVPEAVASVLEAEWTDYAYPLGGAGEPETGSDGGGHATAIGFSRPWLQDLFIAELAESDTFDPNCEL